MNIDKVNNALQDLIIRLQDAEKGFSKIKENTKEVGFKEWMSNLAKERHKQHQSLEKEMSKLGGMPKVKTSVLGDMHRMFIDFKMNFIDDDLDAVIKEIERGNAMLLNDFQKVLDQVSLPLTTREQLVSIKLKIEAEKARLIEFKNMYEAAES